MGDRKKDKTAMSQQPAGVMQQMQPMLNQLLGQHGGKSTRLNMDGTIKDMNAPSGLDWLEAHGPDRASVQARQQRLTQELGGTTQQKAAQGRQAVADKMQWLHDGQPKNQQTTPPAEFTGPPQPLPGKQNPGEPAAPANPNALLPWMTNMYDTYITGKKAPTPAQPTPASATASSPSFNPLSLLGPAASAASDTLSSAGSTLSSAFGNAYDSAIDTGATALNWLGQLPGKARSAYDWLGGDIPSWALDLGANLSAGPLAKATNLPIRELLPKGSDTLMPPSMENRLASELESLLGYTPVGPLVKGKTQPLVHKWNRASSPLDFLP